MSEAKTDNGVTKAKTIRNRMMPMDLGRIMVMAEILRTEWTKIMERGRKRRIRIHITFQ